MIKKGIVITVIFAVNTLVQLINQIVVTRLFGATLTLDIFLAAVALPTVLVTVLYGTINDAFLPLYAHKRNRSESGAQSYFLAHLLYVTGIITALSIALVMFAEPISYLLYSQRGLEFVRQVAFQMRILFIATPCAAIATLIGSYLYAHKNFTRFPMAQLIGNAANLILTVVLFAYFGIWALVVAFIASIVIQIAILNPTKLPKMKIARISMWPFLLAWLPLIVSSFAARSDTLLIRSFASKLPEGYLVYLNLTSRMFSIAAGVSTIGIQILLLPHLVDHVAGKNYARAVRMVNKAKLIGILVAAGTSVALWLIGPYLIHLLFVGGKFSQKNGEIAIVLLPIFLFPAIGWGLQSLFFQPLLAIRKYFHLAVINLIALALGWGSAAFILGKYGVFQGLTFGLIILVFSGIIGSEIIWQYYRRKMFSSASSS